MHDEHRGRITHGEKHIIEELKKINCNLERERVIVIKVECGPTVPVPPVDPPPAAPKAPIIGRGETKTMIEYPVTMPEFVEKDTAKSTLHWSENGAPEQTQDFTTSGATGKLIVNEGAAVEAWATLADKAGNVSEPSPHVSIVSASDTTPPAAPAAPGVGPGQTGDEPEPPLFGKGKKVK